ncbi:unnamed protein product [Caenorhabditis sp. 36 PRJEB53466]|nr:unnamed protein product [Caenorhabditis sp. 36 PRJEB53466]
MAMNSERSSYADLTPVSFTNSSSTPNLDAAAFAAISDADLSRSVKLTKVHEFNRLVAELDFDGGYPDEEITINEEVQVVEEQREESDDEDVNVKYPYERKDRYADLCKRVEERLNNDDSTREIDDRAREIELMLKVDEEKRKMEAKQIGFTHFERPFFTCVMCARSYSSAEELQAHTAKAHDLSGNQWKCKMCGKAYKHRKNLSSHMVLHRKEFQCKECSLVFQSKATLESHISRHNTNSKNEKVADVEKPMKNCDICEKRVPEKLMARHKYYCVNKEQIAKQRAEKKALSVPPSPAMSMISCASFASYQPGPSSSSPMTSPVVSLRDKSCRVCGESFASRQSMLRHVGRKHPEVKDDPNVTAVRYVSVESPTHPYACMDCGKRVTTRAALTAHRARAHENATRHECHVCHKSYIVPSELRKHIKRVHENASTTSSREEIPDIDSIF